MQRRGLNFLQEESGPGAPATAHLQEPGARARGHGFTEPADHEALDHDPHRVVDQQPLGLVELHAFTARWITAMPLVRRRKRISLKPRPARVADTSSGRANMRMDSGR